MSSLLTVVAGGIVGVVGGLAVFERLAPRAAARVLLRLERRRCGLVAKSVRLRDHEVAYLEGGAGEPLILVHGFAATKDHFTRVASYLTPRYRVLIPDLPGFGDSSKAEEASYSIADQVRSLRAFVDALDVGHAHLGGSSMGGFVVTEYAFAHPEAVGSLWLLGPLGTWAAVDSELTRRLLESGENMLVVKTPADFARTADFVMSRRPYMPYSVRQTLTSEAVANHALHSRIFQEIGPEHAPPLDTRLGNLSIPTLVIWGKEDRVLSPDAAATYAAAMPRAEVLLMDGIGHLPMVESPRRTALAYLHFRARLSPAAIRSEVAPGRDGRREDASGDPHGDLPGDDAGSWSSRHGTDHV